MHMWQKGCKLYQRKLTCRPSTFWLSEKWEKSLGALSQWSEINFVAFQAVSVSFAGAACTKRMAKFPKSSKYSTFSHMNLIFSALWAAPFWCTLLFPGRSDLCLRRRRNRAGRYLGNDQWQWAIIKIKIYWISFRGLLHKNYRAI